MKKFLLSISLLLSVIIGNAQNNALLFNTSNNYVDCGNILTTTYTKEAWIKLSSNAVPNNIISGSNVSQHVLWASGGTVSAGNTGATTVVSDPAGVLPVGVWYHFAVTYNAVSQQMKLFKNGVMVSSAAGVGFTLGTGIVYLGAFDPGQNRFEGEMDEVRIWNTERTASEILNNYNKILTGSESGLTQYYNFNQTSGTNLPDLATGDGVQNGTLIGLSGSPWVASTAPLVTNNALNFDGTNDIVTVPYNASLTLAANPFTIEYWARPTIVDANNRWIINKGEANGDLDYLVGLGSNQKFTFAARNLGIYFFAPTTTAIVGNWYHVANVYDGSSAKIYVNGVLEASTTIVGIFVNNTSNVVIGARRESGVQTQFFQGDVDEVRIWNTARTAAQIRNSYNQNLTGTEPGLVAYYPFNQGIANGTNTTTTILSDVTAPAENGTLSGFALTGTTSNWVSGVVYPASTLLGTTISVGTGSNPYRVAIADFNNDGNQDLATANIGVFTFSIVTGSGTGSFGSAVNYSSGVAGPISIVASDYNGDGWADVAVLNNSGPNVTVYTNTGLGTFGSGTPYSTSGNPNVLVNGDFNGDGKMDLAVSQYTTPTIGVFLNIGNGTFATRVDYTGPINLQGLAAGDINGDGVLDLVTASNSTPVLSVLTGTGIGTFGTKVDYATIGGARSVTIGDFNRDGFNDVAAAVNGTDQVSVLLGTGVGTLSTKLDYTTGDDPFGIGNADMNGDGFVDLVVANYSAGTISVHTNSGTGTFGTKIDFTVSNNPTNITLADLNKDQKPDIAVGHNSVSNVSVILNTFSAPTSISFVSISAPVTTCGIATLASTFTGSFLQYQWFRNGTSIAGANAATLNTNVVGNYYVVASNLDFSTTSTGTSLTNCNNALDFDGTDDFVNIGNNSSLVITGDITLEAWINADAWKTNSWEGTIIAKEQETPISGYDLRCGNNGQLSFNLGNGTGWVEILSPVSAMTLNQWTHVAGVKSGSTMSLYINGNLVATGSFAGSIASTTTPLYIGNSAPYPSRTFNGKIDEVKIWNIALSQADIQLNRFKTLSNTVSGLVAYYDFNQGVPSGSNAGVTTLFDKSGNGNNGALTNLSLTGTNSNWLSASNTTITSPFAYTTIISNQTASQTVCSGVTLPLSVTATGTSLTYQWFKDNVLISGATASTLTLTGVTTTNAGTYFVSVTGLGGTVTSAGIALGVGCNNVLDFDGVNAPRDFVSFPINFVGQPSSQITLEAWINPTNISPTTFSDMIRTDGVTSNGFFFSFQDTGTILSFGTNLNGSLHELDIPITRSNYENQWVHIAATYDGQTKKVYRNGVLIGSFAITGSIPPSTACRIGSDGGAASFYHGKMDEVRIWNIALSQAEIQANMSKNLSTTVPGLVVYYDFNQGIPAGVNTSQTTLIDRSGRGINGTLTNFGLNNTATSNYVSATGGVTTIAGFVASPTNALQFDGNGAAGPFVAVSSNSNDFNLGTNFAMEAWVNLTTLSNGYQTIFSKGQGQNNNGYIFQISNLSGTPNELHFNYTNPANYWVRSGIVVPTNTWSHVAVSFNNTTSIIGFYLNGVNVTNVGINVPLNLNPGAGDFFIGKQGDNCNCNRFNGQIDEARIWNIALSPADIQANINRTISTTLPGLVAAYNFDQGIGGGNNTGLTTLIDQAGGNHNGTLNSFTNLAGGNTSNWVNSTTTISGIYAFAPTTITGISSSQTVCSGLTVPLSVTATGTSLTYQWFRNNVLISGATASTLTLTGVTATSAGTYFVSVSGFVGSTTSAGIALGVGCNNAIDFDGTDDEIIVGNISQLNLTSNFTAEAWVFNRVNTTGTDFMNTIFSKKTGGGPSGWALFINEFGSTNGRLVFETTNGNFLVSTNTNSVPVNQWSHVAVSVNQGVVSMYINGVAVSTTWTGSFSAVSSSTTFRIGNFEGASFFMNGIIDEARIWNISLSQQDIQNNLFKNISTTTAGLVGYWDFNQGIPSGNNTTITSALDKSGNGSNGTLTNFTLNGGASNFISSAQTTIIGTYTFTAPSITGITSSQTVCSGVTLPLSVTATGSGLSYQWFRNNVLIAGATASSLTLTGVTTTSAGTYFVSVTGLGGSVTSSGIALGVGCNNALHLDGIDDFVRISNPFTAFSKEITVESWVEYNNSSSIFRASQGSVNIDDMSSNVWLIDAGTGNDTNFGVNNSGSWVQLNLTGITNGWHHMAMVASGTNFRVYVDGLEVAATTGITGTIQSNGAAQMDIGHDVRYNGIRYGKNRYDNFRVWNIALSQADIQANRFRTITSTLPGLVAAYDFNSGIASGLNTSITTLNDISGNNRNGILNGPFTLNGGSSNWVSSNTTINGSYAFVNPTITGITSSQTVCSGVTLPLSVTATGSGLTYQWFKDNVAIPSATASTLTLAGVTTTSAGTYFVSVSGLGGSVTSAGIALGIGCNNALDFDGLNDGVALLSNPVLNNLATNQLTIEAWINISSNGTLSIVRKDGDYNFYVDNQKLSLEPWINGMGNTSWRRYVGTQNISLNTWTHVAVVYSNNIAVFYINGVQESINTFSSNNISNNETLKIGYSSAYGNYFIGKMDELKIWNIALSQSDIVANRFKNLSTTVAGLVAYFDFNQAFAGGNNSAYTSLTDRSGNNLTGTLQNFTLNGAASNWISATSTTITSAFAFSVPIIVNQTSSQTVCTGVTLPLSVTATGTSLTYQWYKDNVLIPSATASLYNVVNITATGTYFVSVSGLGGSVTSSGIALGVGCNNALNFLKTNSNYVSVPHSSSLNLGANFTIEAWVNYSGNDLTIIDKGNYDYTFQIANASDGGRLAMYSSGNGGWFKSTSLVPTNTWTHVAVVIGGGIGRFYINGVLDGTFGWANLSQDGLPMNIGRQQPSSCQCNHFNGSMDELKIWNIALSASDITANRFANVPGTTTGLAAYYKFDQGLAGQNNAGITSVLDASANANHGTLQGTFTLNGGSSNWVSSPTTISGMFAFVTPSVTGISANQTVCSGVTLPLSVTVSGSGLAYQWYKDNILIPSATFSSLTLTGLTATSAGTYFVSVTGFGGSVTSAGIVLGVGCNNALNFAGNPNQLNLGTDPRFNLQNNFTLEAWVRIPSVTGTKRRLFNRSSGGSGYGFGIEADGKLGGTNYGVADLNPTSTGTLTANTWNHVAFVVQNNIVSYYINGLPSGTSPSGAIPSIPTADFKAGFSDYNNSESFVGDMDEVRIWNVALSATDIQANINKTPISTLTGLIATYDFNQGLPNENNSSINRAFEKNGGIVGTLSGFALNGSTSNWVGSITTINGAYAFATPSITGISPSATVCSGVSQTFTVSTTGVSGAIYQWFKDNVAVPNATLSGITIPNVTGANTGNYNVIITSLGGNMTSGGINLAIAGREINVQGNAISIADGSSFPTLSNGTDFGSVSANVNNTQTFTIQNTGTDVLTVSSINISGPDASSYSISGASFPLQIAASSNATFVLNFRSVVLGAKNATITINNNDCDESIYDFNVTGNLFPTAPFVAVSTITSCPSATVTLSATSTGYNLNWFTTSTGGSAFATGTNVLATNVNPSVNTTYYAEAVFGGSGSQTFNYAGAIVTYTVPSGVTSLNITARGAQGGKGNHALYIGGNGASMQGDFTVTPGQVLKVLVGQMGGSAVSYGGGGGGTFVTDISNNPLIIAGGGAGANGANGLQGDPGKTTNNGGNGGDNVGPNQYMSGTSGNGGAAGGNGSSGGGGLLSNGGTTACAACNSQSFGLSFVNGGTGGNPSGCNSGGAAGIGGFGGGSAGEFQCQGSSGAGGGYNGGGGTQGGFYSAGGGGSFNNGTNQNNTAGANSGNGSVVITYNVPQVFSASRTPVSVLMKTEEINIKGNITFDIASGDLTPALNDGSNFGLAVLNTPIIQTFTIQNTGTSVLNINNISFSGANAANFSVTSAPITSVANGSSANFTVQFLSTTLGIKNANVVISNSDCDESVYTFALTANITAAGSALDFAGDNDFVSVASLNATPNFTFEAWINIPSYETGWRTIVEFGNDAPYFGLSSGTNLAIAGVLNDPTPMPLNTWTHIAATYDLALNRTSLFRNGIQVASITGAPTRNGVGMGIGFNSGDNAFKGQMDEVRIWNRALTTSEIFTNMSCNPSSGEPNLLARYDFNQGNAESSNAGLTTVLDLSGNGNNGTATNFTMNGANSNWVAGGRVNANCTNGPEINIKGNAVSITNGSATPTTVNGTNFGTVFQGSTVARNFIIENIGSTILGVSLVSISGTNASDFTITQFPSSTIEASTFSGFNILFNASSAGSKTAVISILNNDADEGLYQFTISGTSLPVSASALAFDGSNDFVSLGNNNELNFNINKPFTIQFWTNFTGINYRAILSKFRASIGDNGYEIYSGDGKIGIALLQSLPSNANLFLRTLKNTLNDGQWHHVSISYDGGINPDVNNFKTFIDGYLEDNEVNSQVGTITNFTTTSAVTIGARTSGGTSPNYYLGRLDNLSFWNTTLTQAQIRANILNTTLSGGEPNLLAYYDFNQSINPNGDNSGFTTLANQTTLAGANGTLTGFLLNGNTSNWVSSTSLAFMSPTITGVSGNQTACYDDDSPKFFDVFATGSVLNYQWYVNATTLSGNNSQIDYDPTGTRFNPGTYTYKCVVSNWLGSATSSGINLTINATPTVTGTATPNVVCLGQPVLFAGNGANDYEWSDGIVNNQAFFPTISGSYMVTGTSAGNCIGTGMVNITVLSVPTVTGMASKNPLCLGESTTLVGTGAVNYVWQNPESQFLANNSVISPTISGTYFLSGTDANGCTTNATNVTITVNQLPNITFKPFPNSVDLVCLGQPASLSAQGAFTYTFTGGILNGTQFTPSSTTNYTVLGTDINGCKNSVIKTVTVIGLPTVTGTVLPSNSVCDGTEVTISGFGANTYTYTGGVFNNVGFVPSSSAIYTITGLVGTGCSATNVVTLTVLALPTVTGSVSPTAVCSGNTVTFSGFGANSYMWSENVIDRQSFTPISIATIFDVTGTGINGCTNTAQVNLILNDLPNIGFDFTNGLSSVCLGQSIGITATGNNLATFTWSGSGFTTAGINVLPNIIGQNNYEVIATDINGCKGINTARIEGLSVPSLSTILGVSIYGTSYNQTVGINSNTIYTVSGTLPPGLVLNQNSGVVSGVTSIVGFYSFDITSDNGTCSSLKSYSINVLPAPLTVQARDTSVYQFAPFPTMPQFKSSITGLALGDNISISYFVSTTTTETIGSYTITPIVSGSILSNYILTTIAGTFNVISPLPLTVTAPSFTRQYGDIIPTTIVSRIVGLEVGDIGLVSAPFVTETSTATGLGLYQVTIGGITGSAAYKYQIVRAINGIQTVRTRRLTIRTFDLTIAESQLSDLPTTFAGSIIGLIPGGDVPILTYELEPIPGFNDRYTITPEVSNINLTQYALVILPGTMYVKSGITIIGGNFTKTYGQNNPALSGQVLGIKSADPYVYVSFQTVATPNSPVGEYTVYPVITGSDASKYGYITVTGVITVTKANLTVAGANQTRLSTLTSPFSFTPVITGAIAGDVIPVDLTTDAPDLSTTGMYMIYPSVSGIAFTNYNVTTFAGTLTIATVVSPPISITVSAGNFSRKYGEADGNYTYSLNGIINQNDNITISVQSNATFNSPIGTYQLTPVISGLDTYKYDFTTVAGTLTIQKNTVTVTALDYSRGYGDANPPFFNASVSGLLNGDQLNAFAFVNENQFSNAGTYDIFTQILGAVPPNYDVITVAGKLIINKAVLTLIGGTFERMYNQPNPVLAFNLIGYKGADQIGMINQLPIGQTIATLSTPVAVSGYPVIYSGGFDNNYDFVYQEGSIKIDPSTQTITGYNPIARVKTGESVTLSAYATSGLPLEVSSRDTNIVTNQDLLMKGKTDGETYILLKQSGDANYLAADSVLIAISSQSTGIKTTTLIGIFGSNLLFKGVQAEFQSTIVANYRYSWSYRPSLFVPENINWVNPLDTTTSKVKIVFPSNINVILPNPNDSSRVYLGDIICKVYDDLGNLMKINKIQLLLNVDEQAAAIAQLAQTLAVLECPPAVTNCTKTFISTFNYGKRVNVTDKECNGGFSDFTASGRIDTLVMGNPYNFKIGATVATNTSSLIFFAIWIDYDNNGSFNDPDDFLRASSEANNLFEIDNLTIRNNDKYEGPRRIRISMKTSKISANESCLAEGVVGETEDYMIYVKKPQALEAATLVTPNADEKNDFFVIRGMNAKNPKKLLILDRWGTQIYKTDDYQNDWDGKDGNGKQVSDGTYYYYFDNGTDENNNKLFIKGFLELKTK